MNKFYMVWVEGKPTPTKKHDSFESAKTEAERIASKQPGDKAIILESVGHYEKQDVAYIRHAVAGFPAVGGYTVVNY